MPERQQRQKNLGRPKSTFSWRLPFSFKKICQHQLCSEDSQSVLSIKHQPQIWQGMFEKKEKFPKNGQNVKIWVFGGQISFSTKIRA